MRIKIKEKKIFRKIIENFFGYKLESINSFCTDSREVKQNDIFIPIKGDYVDPHCFIFETFDKNPSLIFSEKIIKDYLPNGNKTTTVGYGDTGIINVESTMDTLKNIASELMKFFKSPTIAITGSNGKTTTKEMLVDIFNYEHKVNHTMGNYNSSIGLPVNLFNFCLNADLNILEMGASKPDEIDYLCQIIKPDYSLITNIQNAHIGNFSSFDELINTKTAIFRNTKIDGLVFENLDDINISNYCKDIHNKVSFSFNDTKADFFGEITDSKALFINGKPIFNSNLNQIMAQNMLASYSIANTYGIEHDVIQAAFKNFHFLKGRGSHINKNGYLIIDDTYNANFDSFKIGIDDFMDINCKGNKVLIIGDMKELGEKSPEYHIQLGEYINSKVPDFVFSFGNLISKTTLQIKNKKTFSKHFDTMDSLINNLNSYLTVGDHIYIKASRSMKFENIIDRI